MPTAWPSPCPSEPPIISTPGVDVERRHFEPALVAAVGVELVERDDAGLGERGPQRDRVMAGREQEAIAAPAIADWPGRSATRGNRSPRARRRCRGPGRYSPGRGARHAQHVPAHRLGALLRKRDAAGSRSEALIDPRSSASILIQSAGHVEAFGGDVIGRVEARARARSRPPPPATMRRPTGMRAVRSARKASRCRCGSRCARAGSSVDALHRRVHHAGRDAN